MTLSTLIVSGRLSLTNNFILLRKTQQPYHRYYHYQKSTTNHRDSNNTVQRRLFSNRRRRNGPIDSAKKLLGLANSTTSFTIRELRHAYFQAAKLCHPDLQEETESGDNNYNESFNALTEAYELLQQQHTGAVINDYGITEQEERDFRMACQANLGVAAETVEESKRCPIFREWLKGKTDAAQLWNSFFAHHGGLAPMLRPPVTTLLEQNKDAITMLSENRKQLLNRRKRRR